MLVSEQRKFVFVHVFKTGGTSVKRVLRRYAMPAWQEWANVVLKRVGVPQFGPRGYPDHQPVRELIETLGWEAYRRYFSFAFVRNPWDWEISHYQHILRVASHPSHREVEQLGSFEEYLRWRCDGRFQLQSDLLTHEDKLAVDFVGRYERLTEDFAEVCRRLGIRARLPRLNAHPRAPVSIGYTERTADWIRTTYQRDIEWFGYESPALPRSA